MEPMSRRLNTLNMRRAGGGQVKFYPCKKGGVGWGGGGEATTFSNVEGDGGGQKRFWVSFSIEA